MFVVVICSLNNRDNLSRKELLKDTEPIRLKKKNETGIYGQIFWDGSTKYHPKEPFGMDFEFWGQQILFPKNQFCCSGCCIRRSASETRFRE